MPINPQLITSYPPQSLSSNHFLKKGKSKKMDSSSTSTSIASLQRRVGGLVSTYILLQLVLAPLLYPHGYTAQLLLLSYLAYHVCFHQPPSTVNSSNATMKEMILQLLEVTILIYTFMDLFFAHQHNALTSSSTSVNNGIHMSDSFDIDVGMFENREEHVELCFDTGAEDHMAASVTPGLSSTVFQATNSTTFKERTFSEFLLRLCFLFVHMYYSDRIQGIVSMILPHHTQEADQAGSSTSASTLSPMVTLFLVGELILSPYLYPIGYLAQLFLLLFLIAYFVLCDGYVFHNHQHVAQFRAMKAQQLGKALPSEEEERAIQKVPSNPIFTISNLFISSHLCSLCDRKLTRRSFAKSATHIRLIPSSYHVHIRVVFVAQRRSVILHMHMATTMASVRSAMYWSTRRYPSTSHNRKTNPFTSTPLIDLFDSSSR